MRVSARTPLVSSLTCNVAQSCPGGYWLADFDEVADSHRVIDFIRHGGTTTAERHDGVAAFECASTSLTNP